MQLNILNEVAALQRLTIAYFVPMEGNAKTGAGGYDYRWHEIAPLARNLATSPLYAFHYLKKSLRREGSDTPSGYKAALYINLEPVLGALFALLLLSEHISPLEGVGGAVTATALLLLPRGRRLGKGHASPEAVEPAIDEATPAATTPLS